MRMIEPHDLLDPELLAALERLPREELSAETLGAHRARADEDDAPAIPDDLAQRIDRSVHRVRAETADASLWLYRPNDAREPLPCIYHIHGGGYVCGRAAQFETYHRQLALDFHCAVAAIDYRLAPETRFPGNIEDCYAGLAWLHAHAGECGIDPTRLGVMGESAGGGLAACLALLARDRAEYALSFQHLTYPMLDDRTASAPVRNLHAGTIGWTRASNAYAWRAMLGAEPGGPHTSRYAAAARAADLSNLPPAFIACPTLDLLIDENIDYTRRLMHAGVPVELHVYPGGFHGFDVFAPEAGISSRARRDSADALRRFLAVAAR